MNLPTIEYGNVAIDFNTVPEQSIKAILSSGVTHRLGNEVNAKVGPNSAWQTKFAKDNSRKPTDDEREAQLAVFRSEMLDKIMSGTIGTARGPKLDPIEAEIERMATNEVWDKLSGAKLCKKNKRPDDDEVFTFANGDQFTFEVLIDRAIVRGGDAMRATATKKVEAERRAKEKRKADAEKVAASGPVDVAALNL